MAIGGLCWETGVLRWIVEHGFDAVPDVPEWIPNIFKSLNSLLYELDAS